MIHILFQYHYRKTRVWAVAIPAHVVLAAMVLATLASPSRAHDLRHGDIHIGHVWAKPAAAGGSSVSKWVPIMLTAAAVLVIVALVLSRG